MDHEHYTYIFFMLITCVFIAVCWVAGMCHKTIIVKYKCGKWILALGLVLSPACPLFPADGDNEKLHKTGYRSSLFRKRSRWWFVGFTSFGSEKKNLQVQSLCLFQGKTAKENTGNAAGYCFEKRSAEVQFCTTCSDEGMASKVASAPFTVFRIS